MGKKVSKELASNHHLDYVKSSFIILAFSLSDGSPGPLWRVHHPADELGSGLETGVAGVLAVIW
ncbi:MAG: hypothetical protein WBE37_12280 [Bryobacteraceae bacterium]